MWVAHPAAEWAAPLVSRERLRSEAELRLSLAGVSLREAEEDTWQGGPCLGVIVNLKTPEGTGSCPFSLEVFYVEGQPTALGPFGPSLHLKWCRETCGEVRHSLWEVDWQPLYEALGHLVQEFLEDYLSGEGSSGGGSRLVN